MSDELSLEFLKLAYESKKRTDKANDVLLDLVKTLEESLKTQQEQWFTRCSELNNKNKKEIEAYEELINELADKLNKLLKDKCRTCHYVDTDNCEPSDYSCGAYISMLRKIKDFKNDR